MVLHAASLARRTHSRALNFTGSNSSANFWQSWKPGALRLFHEPFAVVQVTVPFARRNRVNAPVNKQTEASLPEPRHPLITLGFGFRPGKTLVQTQSGKRSGKTETLEGPYGLIFEFLREA